MASRDDKDIRDEVLKILDIMERYMEVLRQLIRLQGSKDIDKKGNDD